ncbi:hypothetical protein U3516DRAFT_767335 [Neocallimastix sp. 'constans']|jgi:hypothetical protein
MDNTLPYEIVNFSTKNTPIEFYKNIEKITVMKNAFPNEILNFSTKITPIEFYNYIKNEVSIRTYNSHNTANNYNYDIN